MSLEVDMSPASYTHHPASSACLAQPQHDTSSRSPALIRRRNDGVCNGWQIRRNAVRIESHSSRQLMAAMQLRQQRPSVRPIVFRASITQLYSTPARLIDDFELRTTALLWQLVDLSLSRRLNYHPPCKGLKLFKHAVMWLMCFVVFFRSLKYPPQDTKLVMVWYSKIYDLLICLVSQKPTPYD